MFAFLLETSSLTYSFKMFFLTCLVVVVIGSFLNSSYCYMLMKETALVQRHRAGAALQQSNMLLCTSSMVRKNIVFFPKYVFLFLNLITVIHYLPWQSKVKLWVRINWRVMPTTSYRGCRSQLGSRNPWSWAA